MSSEGKPADTLTESAQRGGPESGAGLKDPTAIDILTAEHLSLLSTRTLGSTEVFARASIFAALLSGMVVALSFLAQATRFGPETTLLAFVLVPVILFIGLTTFVRSVALNQEDARWVTGMNLIRHAYVQINPAVQPFFVADHEARPARGPLGQGSRQRLRNLASSLTTTSGVIAALDSILAGAIASIAVAQVTGGILLSIAVGSVVSILAAAGHVAYAARARETHSPM